MYDKFDNYTFKQNNSSYITLSYLRCNNGTWRGDVTSTTFFSLFINELSDMLRQTFFSGMFISIGIPEIICLMYVDDIANCVETNLKVQKKINVIDTFCENTGTEINLQNTQISNGIPEIICLMYVDDIANCVETNFEVQKKINVIDTFCENTGTEINLQNTQIIVFRESVH